MKVSMRRVDRYQINLNQHAKALAYKLIDPTKHEQRTAWKVKWVKSKTADGGAQDKVIPFQMPHSWTNKQYWPRAASKHAPTDHTHQAQPRAQRTRTTADRIQV